MEGVAAVQVVTRSVEAFNRRDLEGFLATLDPGVELLPFSAQLDGQPYLGHAGARRWLDEVEDEWSRWHVTIDELRPLGDRVLATGRIEAKGRETGVDVEVPTAFISTVHDGLLTRLESFDDAARALTAV